MKTSLISKIQDVADIPLALRFQSATTKTFKLYYRAV